MDHLQEKETDELEYENIQEKETDELEKFCKQLIRELFFPKNFSSFSQDKRQEEKLRRASRYEKFFNKIQIIFHNNFNVI